MIAAGSRAAAGAARLPLAAFLLPPACGVLVATALPPWHFLPGLLGFAGLLYFLLSSDRPSRAFLTGFLFGLGFYLTGLYWIAIAFYADAERFAALAIPGVVMLSAACALFPGIAALLLSVRRWRSPLAAAFALALLWVASDLARGILLLGFPWNPIAIVWADQLPMLQPLAWVGTPALSALTVLVASAPATFLLTGGLLTSGLLTSGRQRVRGIALSAAVLLAWAALGSARLHLIETPAASDVMVRIVQANLSYHHAYDTDRRREWFRRHLDVTATPAETPVDVVVWPETSVPYQLEQEPAVRRAIAGQLAPGAHAIVGGDRYVDGGETPVLRNTVFVLDDGARIVEAYDKVNLVPFGEFLPFRPVFAAVGLDKLTPGSIDFRPGPKRRTLRVQGVPAFSPLVCYEAIFAGRAVDPDDRPAWLLNITNDAWFGDSAGPHQHLAQARMRTVEEGLPLVRAAISGISAVVDPLGRELARLPLGERGVLDTYLPGALPEQTFYRATRTASAFSVFLVLLCACVLCERRSPVGKS